MAAIDQLPTLLQGTYRFISVVYPPPIEELQGTPTALTNTTPASPQISYTLTSDMFPYLDPASALLNTPKYHAFLIAAGHNLTSSRTIRYAGYKNGAPAMVVQQGAAANVEWTVVGIFADVIVGDLLEVYLLSLGAGAQWDYTALVVFIDSVQVADDTHLLGRVEHSLSYWPFLSQGMPTIQSIGPFHAAHEGLIGAALGVGARLDALIMAAPDYSGRIHYGNETTASLWFTGTARPMYVQNIAPLGFLFWETGITTGTINALPDDLQGVPKTFAVTYPGAVETLDATPPDLPTSLPGSPQFSWTIAAGDLPTIASPPLSAPKYHALIYLAGENTNALGRDVTCEVWKNGVLFTTATNSVPSNYFWTLNSFVPDVMEGDTIEVFAYASDTDVTWDYQGYALGIDEIQVAPADRLLANVEYSLIDYPVLTAGAPLVSGIGPFRIQHLGTMEAEIDVDTSLTCQVQRSSMYSGWSHYGHLAHTASVEISDTNRPAYFQNKALAGITFILTDITV